MIGYMLKSGACLLIFYLFYRLLLEKESMHVFKRFYLLIAMVTSFLIPLLTVTYYTEEVIPDILPLARPVLETAHTNHLPDADVFNTSTILWTIYFIGLLFFAGIFFKNLTHLLKRIKSNPTDRTGKTTKVLVPETVIPHTFLRYIFLNRASYESHKIPQVVLIHEETHAIQKHSLDILFVEMLKVFLWFNPLIYLMRSAIKLNHEFLADKTVLNKNFDPVDYQNAILSFSTLDDQEKIHQPSLANAIDYSSTRHALGVIKKRFTVMKIQTSKTAVFIRSMLLLPLTALVLFGFSNKVAIPVAKELQPELYSIHLQEKASGEMMARYTTLAKKYNLQPVETRVVPPEDLRTLETIYNKMTEGQKRNAQPFPECLPPQKKPQDGASKKQLKEYNTLARKYNAMSRNDFHVIGREVKRIKHIYDLMTEAQKETAEPFPDFPVPPPPPPAPAAPQADGIVVIASSPQSPVSSPHVTAEVGPPPPPPPSPTAPDAVVVADHIPAPPSPPIPPEPRSPADFARDMAEQNAEFYYNGEKISAARAIELLENSEHINLRARHTGLKNPVVELSTSPLEIKEDQ